MIYNSFTIFINIVIHRVITSQPTSFSKAFLPFHPNA